MGPEVISENHLVIICLLDSSHSVSDLQVCRWWDGVVPRRGRPEVWTKRRERHDPLQLRHVPLRHGTVRALPALQRAAVRAGRPDLLHRRQFHSTTRILTEWESLNSFLVSSRAATPSLRGKRWGRVPARACCRTDQSGSRCPTDLSPVSSESSCFSCTSLSRFSKRFSVSGLLTTVVLPVAAVWALGFFLTVLVTVAKAGSRRIAKMEERWRPCGCIRLNKNWDVFSRSGFTGNTNH